MLNPGELLAAMGVGVLATLLSVVGPSLTATRVSPIEALQAVPSAARAKRLSVTRAVLCVLFGVGGIALVVLSRAHPEWSLVWAMGAGFLLSVAILGAAPFFIPPLLRLLGRIFGFTGATTRLAASNAARNPQRAAATAVALMLAVGLVVTLQAAVSTVRTSGVEAINKQFPVDLTLTSEEALPGDLLQQIGSIEGVQQSVEIPSKRADIEGDSWAIRSVNPAHEALGLPDDQAAPDGVIIVPDFLGMSGELELPGVLGPVKLQIKGSQSRSWGAAAVSEATFEQLVGEPVAAEMWVKLADRTSVTALNEVVGVANAAPGEILVDGGALVAGML